MEENNSVLTEETEVQETETAVQEDDSLKMADLQSYDKCIGFIATRINPVVSTAPKTYPFVGEKTVRARLAQDPDLRVANAVLMYHLQEAQEQVSKETIAKNGKGLMSSHAKTGTKIVQGLLAGIAPNPELVFKADGQEFQGGVAYLEHIGGRYAKQLAVCLRSLAISRQPELATVARMFSVE